MSNIAPTTSDEILAFCDVIQKRIAEHFAKHLDRLTPPTVSPDKGGRKFIRIVRQDVDGSGRSVIVFVEKSTGLIWKPDGWKGPEKNFPRGNIRDERGGQGAVTENGSAATC